MNQKFIKTVTALSGDAGKKWLGDLPSIIKQYEEKWDITVFPPFHLSYNYVAPAKTQNGDDVVLKISFPGNREFVSETESLKFFNGQGAIRLLGESRKWRCSFGKSRRYVFIF